MEFKDVSLKNMFVVTFNVLFVFNFIKQNKNGSDSAPFTHEILVSFFSL